MPGELETKEEALPKVFSSPITQPGSEPIKQAILELKAVAPEREQHDFRKPDDYKVTTVKSTEELINIIKSASGCVRVVGSQHSFAKAIYADSAKGVNLVLGPEFRKYEVIKEGIDKGGKYALVSVGAGCHLGVDPSDKLSKEENSLNYQLLKSGYSLPIVGGITHQTVGGFMQTGSAGGSIFFGFADCLESIEFINGKGEIRTTKRGEPLFDAVGVSMGLMGVITKVVLRVEPAFTVEATEQLVAEKDSWIAPESDGTYPFEKLIKDEKEHPYIHINWFPQKDVRRVIQWSGKRKGPFEEGEEAKEYTNILAKISDALAAGGLLAFVNLILTMHQDCEIPDIPLGLISAMLNEVLKLSEPKTYRDHSYKILATEDTAPVDTIMRTIFTEIWFPIKYTKNVIAALKELYNDPKIALGNYGMEIYCAKSSPFWLSPAYKRDVIRIDPLRWAYNTTDHAKFFQTFFDKLLHTIPDGRIHWGKYLPKVNTDFNINTLKVAYPKMEDWLKIREEMDPKQIFLNAYWREVFNISFPIEPSKAPSLSLC